MRSVVSKRWPTRPFSLNILGSEEDRVETRSVRFSRSQEQGFRKVEPAQDPKTFKSSSNLDIKVKKELLREAGRSVFLWYYTRKKIEEKAFKKERESDGQPYLSLYVAREPSSTSLATSDSITLFGGSFVLHSLAITRRERSKWLAKANREGRTNGSEIDCFRADLWSCCLDYLRIRGAVLGND
ncbi:unnamed protein product [Dovyalis caffra]|uniref:Uncharacterized protein n=1 Tax=Dovyalis caffra TaxID=77055 RepID=A0AAV1R8H0_9ROSI|nr:unnamed protein product [Dovyalis caffra]CAK7328683.1 unnamed protein product [Dovyalis caffra]